MGHGSPPGEGQAAARGARQRARPLAGSPLQTGPMAGPPRFRRKIRQNAKSGGSSLSCHSASLRGFCLRSCLHHRITGPVSTSTSTSASTSATASTPVLTPGALQGANRVRSATCSSTRPWTRAGGRLQGVRQVRARRWRGARTDAARRPHSARSPPERRPTGFPRRPRDQEDIGGDVVVRSVHADGDPVIHRVQGTVPRMAPNRAVHGAGGSA